MRWGIAAFSIAVNSGSRWWYWKTNPIFSFRNRARSRGGSSSSDWPKISTRPESGRSIPPSRCSSVDFPTPDGPMIAAKARSSRTKERSLKTVTGAPSPA